MTTPRRMVTREEVDAMVAAFREARERGLPIPGADGLVCGRCGAGLVEVDNPMRRELRHRRGQECDAA